MKTTAARAAHLRKRNTSKAFPSSSTTCWTPRSASSIRSIPTRSWNLALYAEVDDLDEVTKLVDELLNLLERASGI